MSLEIKKIAFAFNPISGKGRSELEARRVSSELSALGFQCVILESLVDLDSNFDLFILAGGDGTLRKFLQKLIETQVPVYMLPTGNESLFSKEFSMSLDIRNILKNIKNKNVVSGFVPTINGESFFSMVSIGLDSQVVSELTKVRRGSVSHLSYVWPLLKSIWSHKSPIINLSVDGQVKIVNKKGYLLIGNTKQYALGIRFVPEAGCFKGSLLGVFVPYKSVLEMIFIYLIKVFCPQKKIKNSHFFEGSSFEITHLNYPIQVDGDSMPLNNQLRISTGICRIQILLGK